MQTMNHIADARPLTRSTDGDLSRLHSDDNCAVCCVAANRRGESTHEMSQTLQFTELVKMGAYNHDLMAVRLLTEGH